MQPPIELPNLTAEEILISIKRREVISLKLRELNTTLKDKAKKAILIEQFVRFLALDFNYAQKAKIETAKLNTNEYNLILSQLKKTYKTEVEYAEALIKSAENHYATRQNIYLEKSDLVTEIQLAHRYQTSFHRDTLTLLLSGVNTIEGKPLTKEQHAIEHFIHLTEHCYLTRTFCGQPTSKDYSNNLGLAYDYFNRVQTEINNPMVNAYAFLLIFCDLQSVPYDADTLDKHAQKKYASVQWKEKTDNIKFFPPYIAALYCYHLANFSETYHNFSSKIVGSRPDKLKKEWQDKIPLFAAKITDEATQNLLSLLSLNRPVKIIESNALKIDNFKIWFIEAKRDFYTQGIAARIVALKKAVIADRWPEQNNYFFIDALPDPRHLVGFVLHLWQRQLMDNVSCINKNLNKYSLTDLDPNNQAFSFYEVLITFKKDCLEVMREIVQIRSVYFNQVLKINLQEVKQSYPLWLDEFVKNLNVSIDEVRDILSKLADAKSLSSFKKASQLKKYHRLLEKAIAETPERNKFLRLSHRKPATSRVHNKPDTVEIEEEQEPQEAKLESVFDIGYGLLSENKFAEARAHYHREANAVNNNLLLQAKLYYHHAEAIQMHMEAIINDNNKSVHAAEIDALRELAIKYFSQARDNLLALHLDSHQEEVEVWLEFVNDKLGSEFNIPLPDIIEHTIDEIATIQQEETVDQATEKTSNSSEIEKVIALPPSQEAKPQHFLQKCTLRELFASDSQNSLLWFKSLHPLLKRLRRAKIGYYLTGGIVRDKLFGKDFFDVDVSVLSTSLEEVAVLFPNSKIVGKKHPVLLVTSGTKTFEISLLTRDEQGEFNLKLDLSRRFMALDSFVYSPSDHAILDFFDGRSDIAQKKISLLVGGPEKLVASPIMLLRVIRHASKYDITIPKELRDLIPICREKLITHPEDNRYTEIHKTLSRGFSAAAITLLNDLQLLPSFFPSLKEALSDQKLRTFILTALQHYDRKMQMAHKTGLLTNMRLEFCFAILLFPSLYYKEATIKKPRENSTNEQWQNTFYDCIDAIFKETNLIQAMPHHVKNYIKSIWIILYHQHYQVDLSGARMNLVLVRDAQTFSDIFRMSSALAALRDANLVNPGNSRVGFHSVRVSHDSDRNEVVRSENHLAI